jgi:hypothetical protein
MSCVHHFIVNGVKKVQSQPMMVILFANYRISSSTKLFSGIHIHEVPFRHALSSTEVCMCE